MSMADLEDIGLDQAQRLISVDQSPVGNTKVLVTAFDAVEELSTLTRITLEVMTLGRSLLPSEILGQKFGVVLQIRGQNRKFNGIVASLQVMRSTVRDH